MSFENLGLIEPLLRALREEGYTHPTAIQEEAIPHLLAGKDLLGCAQTGTGKTAAFAMPILQRLSGAPAAGDRGKRPIRALIVTPTRELAAQVGESFNTYGRHVPLRQATIFGGVRQGAQVRALKAGVDVLVATPGRLLDLMGQHYVHLDRVEVLVLDEADRMLDMGFIRDIRRIVAAVPAERQTMLFSATMPQSIMHLARSVLREPVEVRVAPKAPAAETVDHQVYFVESLHKTALLQHLLTDGEIERALVFARTKRRADRVLLHLRHAKIDAAVIHSDKGQKERERALENFRTGRTRVLVASDIASRGLDIDDISHVINFDMPNDAETYVHRIGRTGRAGAAGTALSFCGLDERPQLDSIERLVGKALPAVEEHPFRSAIPRVARNATGAYVPMAWRRVGRGTRSRSFGGKRR